MTEKILFSGQMRIKIIRSQNYFGDLDAPVKIDGNYPTSSAIL